MQSITTILFESAVKHLKGNPFLTAQCQWQETYSLQQDQVFHIWELKNLVEIDFEDTECWTAISLMVLLLLHISKLIYK